MTYWREITYYEAENSYLIPAEWLGKDTLAKCQKREDALYRKWKQSRVEAVQTKEYWTAVLADADTCLFGIPGYLRDDLALFREHTSNSWLQDILSNVLFRNSATEKQLEAIAKSCISHGRGRTIWGGEDIDLLYEGGYNGHPGQFDGEF